MTKPEMLAALAAANATLEEAKQAAHYGADPTALALVGLGQLLAIGAEALIAEMPD